MKKVVAGCIDLMLEFASVTELDKYIATIEAKKQACLEWSGKFYRREEIQKYLLKEKLLHDIITVNTELKYENTDK